MFDSDKEMPTWAVVGIILAAVLVCALAIKISGW